MSRSKTERVTVTLPADLVREIDRLERNRSRFVLGAIERELHRRRREALHDSLREPHPETPSIADVGLGQWAEGLPDEDAGGLLDISAGVAIHWVPERGWLEDR